MELANDENNHVTYNKVMTSSVLKQNKRAQSKVNLMFEINQAYLHLKTKIYHCWLYCLLYKRGEVHKMDLYGNKLDTIQKRLGTHLSLGIILSQN